ncbi:exodeoxyribonuclease VII large subunit [Kineosphaera limosa]|uniref:exodeoxyribonuclease VII large subunit n=1 Tax=Kineosphaera limosa TaxID=111564 RepID=UPI00030CE0A8|nr:exodeoxyribonuclease VII large subunit [Kineosphaera limosa]NYE02393.1 exodeoxyribonuclease VII large subunit [Kineosphaera limosa]
MTQPARAPLPERAADTTAEQPWPVRLLSAKMGEYIAKMSAVWVEGQIVELNHRGAAQYCYLTLRDPDADVSLSVSMPVRAFDVAGMPMSQGARVVAHIKPGFWPKRGTLQMEGRAIRPVGEGELLARLEQLKRILAAEGLFAAERKRRLPFLPGCVGLICGRNSAAERDVVENARRRWPALRFEIRQVPVQGTDAVSAVRAALVDLDAQTHVDVIVVARGGGSFEDLLPFSNEALIRAVADARTPVVSAIGHDIDTPLLDFVADLRASTPTDAAKRIVPDAASELAGLDRARGRIRAAQQRRLHGEADRLRTLRSRPVLASPAAMIEPHLRQIQALRLRARQVVSARVDRGADEIVHLRARARALSPQSTLDRGYAVVSHADGRTVTDRLEVEAREVLRVRVARGDFAVTPVTARSGEPEPSSTQAAKTATATKTTSRSTRNKSTTSARPAPRAKAATRARTPPAVTEKSTKSSEPTDAKA